MARHGPPAQLPRTRRCASVVPRGRGRMAGALGAFFWIRGKNGQDVSVQHRLAGGTSRSHTAAWDGGMKQARLSIFPSCGCLGGSPSRSVSHRNSIFSAGKWISSRDEHSSARAAVAKCRNWLACVFPRLLRLESIAKVSPGP